ncbi:MAG TPA: hypothetical protein VFO86_07105, partial [Terriglobia bacterium]|nr:hypothetical protein [Terriglobia bacterium]
MLDDVHSPIMQTLKTLLPYLLLLVVSVAAIVWLAPVTHPSAGLELPMDATTMVQHSRTLLHEIGVNDAGLSTDVQFQINRPLLQQAQRTFGVEQSNLLIRDSIPAYFWTVHWKKVRMWGFSMGNEGESDRQGRDNADLLR